MWLYDKTTECTSDVLFLWLLETFRKYYSLKFLYETDSKYKNNSRQFHI